jgi:hypothetical protein
LPKSHRFSWRRRKAEGSSLLIPIKRQQPRVVHEPTRSQFTYTVPARWAACVFVTHTYRREGRAALREPGIAGKVLFVEIDHPDSQLWKLALGLSAPGVRFLPVNFTSQNLEVELRAVE